MSEHRSWRQIRGNFLATKQKNPDTDFSGAHVVNTPWYLGSRKRLQTSLQASTAYSASTDVLKFCRRVRTKAAAEHQPAVAAVLENYDLLHEILMKLAPGNGCSLATREALARVNRLWQEVALTLPVALNLSMPLTDTQVGFPAATANSEHLPQTFARGG